MVRDERAAGDRVGAGHPVLRHDAAGGLRQRVAARALHPGAVRSPRGARGVDQPGISLGERFVREAEPLQDARPVVREQDERDAALAAVHGEEVVAEIRVLGVRPADQPHQHVSAEIADQGHLDLDDHGPHVREKQSGVRSLDFLGDLDDPDARERSRHSPHLMAVKPARLCGRSRQPVKSVASCHSSATRRSSSSAPRSPWLSCRKWPASAIRSKVARGKVSAHTRPHSTVNTSSRAPQMK